MPADLPPAALPARVRLQVAATRLDASITASAVGSAAQSQERGMKYAAETLGRAAMSRRRQAEKLAELMGIAEGLRHIDPSQYAAPDAALIIGAISEVARAADALARSLGLFRAADARAIDSLDIVAALLIALASRIAEARPDRSEADTDTGPASPRLAAAELHHAPAAPPLRVVVAL